MLQKIFKINAYLAGTKLELYHTIVGRIFEHVGEFPERLPRSLAQPQQVVVDAATQDVGFHYSCLLASCLFEEFEFLLLLLFYGVS